MAIDDHVSRGSGKKECGYIVTHRVNTDVPDEVALPRARIATTGPMAGVRFRSPMPSPVLIKIATIDRAEGAPWYVANEDAFAFALLCRLFLLL